jgi:hypothetical protein
MRYRIGMAIMILVMVIGTGASFAQQKGPVDTVMQGCKQELDQYCKNVTKGEGRVLACLYAYEDKLSGKCVYALYDASNQLERAVTALRYLANECKSDISALCADTQPGEGRILKCIQNNDAKVSARCKQAQKDVGLK